MQSFVTEMMSISPGWLGLSKRTQVDEKDLGLPDKLKSYSHSSESFHTLHSYFFLTLSRNIFDEF